jgi:hypothetical protein
LSFELLEEFSGLALRDFSRIMDWENPMPWFYEIRDSNLVVAATGKGFDTEKAAMSAGRKKARELKASGSLPGGGISIRATNSDDPPEPRGGKVTVLSQE